MHATKNICMLQKNICMQEKYMHATKKYTYATKNICMLQKIYVCKKNPHDQARAPRACQWRKRSEGLEFGCTAKGRKEGQVNINFMVAIAHNKSVVLCQRYDGAITG